MMTTVHECSEPDLFANKQLLGELEENQRPVVVRGGINGWPALVRWSGPNGSEYIKGRTKDALVQVMCSKDEVFFGSITKHTLMSCKMEDFLDEDQQAKWKEMRLFTYLAQGRLDQGPLRALMDDFEIPKSFAESRNDFQVNLWMSLKAKSRSSPHFDPYENFLCLITGKKTVKLYPSSLTSCFYPYPIWSESDNHSTVNFVAPDFTKHPHYKAVLKQESIVELEAGDVVYIPEGWWHQIDSIEGTIGVNVWWTSKHTYGVMKSQNPKFYLRQILKQLTMEKVESIANRIQPLEPDNLISNTSALHQSDVQDSSHPKKKPRTTEITLMDLNDTENIGLKILTGILENKGETDLGRVEIEDSGNDLICRWLKSHSSSSIGRMLYVLSTESSLLSQQFWLQSLTPLACYLLTDHFQIIQTTSSPLFHTTEDFFEALHRVIPENDQVMKTMNEKSEELMKFAFHKVHCIPPRLYPPHRHFTISVNPLRSRPHRRTPSALGVETEVADSLPPWTLDQIVGLAFGALLVTFYFSANVVDKYVAKVQRTQLGLCEECGGLYDSQSCAKTNCPFKKSDL